MARAALVFSAAGGIAVAMAAGVVFAQPADPLRDAREALGRGDVPKAVALADAIIRRNPRSRDAVVVKVEALASARDWEAALAAYDAFVAAGEDQDPVLLGHVGRAVLREAVAFFPSLRINALARLACGGDREALLDLKRAPPPTRDDDLDTLLIRARLGEFDAVVALRELSRSGPAPSRAAALQALQYLRDGGAESAVVAALTQPDPYLRLAGTRAARTLGLTVAEPPLRLLTQDPNPLVAAEAASALASLGVADFLDRLRPLLSSPVPDLRLAALAGQLAVAPTPQTLEGLERIASSRTGTAWFHAIDLLADAAPERAAAAVRQAIEDPSPNVRMQALRLMTRQAGLGQADLPVLHRLVRDPNTLVRIEAATVLVGRSSLCAG